MLNLNCRNTSLKSEVLERLRTVFPAMFISKVEDEVNEIVYALKTSSTGVQTEDVGTGETIQLPGSSPNEGLECSSNGGAISVAQGQDGSSEGGSNVRDNIANGGKSTMFVDRCKLIEKYFRSNFKGSEKPEVDLVDVMEQLTIY